MMRSRRFTTRSKTARAAVAIQVAVAGTPAGAAAWDVAEWAAWEEWAGAWVAVGGNGESWWRRQQPGVGSPR